MKNVFLLGLAICLALLSCKDDDSITNTANPSTSGNIANYTNLSVGNYWIYENIKIDESGIETELARIDSIYIASDTLINGNTYFVQRGKKFLFNNKDEVIDILRDSLGYLVNKDGDIRFSSSNFSDIIYSQEVPITNPQYRFEYKMEEITTTVNLPAGDFDDVYNYRGKVSALDSTNMDSIRYFDNYYAEGLGKIFETTFFATSKPIYEKRLIRYNIQ